ncbi:peptidoglycan bridge formation glycyltransferase FemA/FemB family protein [Candidatus Saccharibacteria bacterium]|nr:peptidoglycan bridge formation glycyltransferase FemA/FemB family protein [Candidatus Saccharibacteria bacterium]
MKKTFRELTPQEFQSFTKRCSSKNYMQSLAMYQRYQAVGRESYLLGLAEGDKVIVAGLVSVIFEKLGHKIFTFSRGPLSDDYNLDNLVPFLQECKQFLKGKHGLILQISPNLLVPDAPADFEEALKQQGFKPLGEYEQVKWTYALPFTKIENLPKVQPPESKSSVLDPPISKEAEQILLRSFRRDHRYTIRYATERYDIRLRELSPEEYPILLDMMNESGKVHGFVPREQQFFEQLKTHFGSDVTAIVAELPDGTPIAAAFFILYGDEVIYLSSGFRRAHKKLGGPHLIQWAMIKYAYANGFKKYNFWGTNPDPENGVFKFKQGFHGEIEEFVGTFAAPLSPVGKVYLQKLHFAKQRDL